MFRRLMITLVFSHLIFVMMPSAKTVACSASNTGVSLVAQVSDSWCWAACLSVLYGEYGATGYT